MAKRELLGPYKVFDAASMAGDLTQATPFSTIKGLDKVGLILEWTGTAPVGEFFVDVSYLIPGTTSYTAWQELDFGAPIAITGNSGNHHISIQDPPFEKMRLRYVRTSGTGSLTATEFGASKGA